MNEIDTQERLRELYNRYWNHTFELARKHNFNCWDIIRIVDKKTKKIENLTGNPIFHYFSEKCYDIQFPEFILDGTPIFKGDIIFNSSGERVKVIEYNKESDMVTVDVIGDCMMWQASFPLSMLSTTVLEKTIKLTNKEIELLVFCVRNPNTTLSPENRENMRHILNKLEN